MSLRGLILSSVSVLAWGALLATGIGCVYAKHEARTRFVALRALERERDQLEIEWGKLQIEQSTWATHSRVENLARDVLDMDVPRVGEMAVLQP
ncbi:MAG: cell division protein FtsL [Gammaproteobacteria bacterium]